MRPHPVAAVVDTGYRTCFRHRSFLVTVAVAVGRNCLDSFVHRSSSLHRQQKPVVFHNPGRIGRHHHREGTDTAWNCNSSFVAAVAAYIEAFVDAASRRDCFPLLLSVGRDPPFGRQWASYTGVGPFQTLTYLPDHGSRV